VWRTSSFGPAGLTAPELTKYLIRQAQSMRITSVCPQSVNHESEDSVNIPDSEGARASGGQYFAVEVDGQ
jgi:hypothetical protein